MTRRVLVPAGIDAAGPALGGQVHALQGRTMGTGWSVRFVGVAGVDLDDWQRGIQSVLDGLVAQMSHWEPGSDLSRFNRLPAGEAMELPVACFTVLAHGLEVARRSGGAHDPTVGALVNCWGFGATGRFDEPGFCPPTAEAADQARQRGGWARLPVEAASRRVQQPGGLHLDFSSIAKGFAVDEVLRHLAARGAAEALVEVGGELRGAGMKPDGSPWWVAIEAPPALAGRFPETVVALHGLAIATSGDYRRGFQWNDRRHAHTIDPRDGRPVQNGVVSVTVLHPECVLADAWSTALTVLGEHEGGALAEAEGLAAHWVVQDAGGRAREHWSPAFETLMN